MPMDQQPRLAFAAIEVRDPQGPIAVIFEEDGAGEIGAYGAGQALDRLGLHRFPLRGPPAPPFAHRLGTLLDAAARVHRANIRPP